MDSIIVSGFPLSGKTYAYQHSGELDLSCIDIDSVCPNANATVYCDCVESYMGRVKHILVNFNAEVRFGLANRRLSFVNVVPTFENKFKEEWFKRAASRPDFQDYLRNLERCYDEWIQPKYINIGHPLYTQYTSEYLSDILDYIE